MDISRCRCACNGCPLRLSLCLHSTLRLWIWGCVFVCFSAIIVAEDDDLLFQPTVDKQKNLFVDDKFVVTCYPREGSNARRITWKDPYGAMITARTGRIHVEESRKEYGIDLFFDGITTRDQGLYNCTAIVDEIDVYKSFEILVFKRISFKNIKEKQFISEGEDELISCEATAYPDPQITWKVNGSEITRPKHETRENGLRIINVTREDAGVYTCRATQMDGAVSDFQDLKIVVIVRYKPDWKEPVVETYYSYIGGVVNMTCEADGVPPPTYFWSHKRNPVESNENMQIYEVDGKSILEIRIQNESDFDNYTCNADNNQGSVDLTIQLLEGAKPAIPEIRIVDSDTYNINVELSMTSKGELEVLGFAVQVKTEDQAWDSMEPREFSLHKREHSSQNDNRFVVEDLKPNTIYNLRAAAWNAVGFGEYSEDVSERTKEAQETPLVATYDNSKNDGDRLISLGSLVSVAIVAFVAGLAL